MDDILASIRRIIAEDPMVTRPVPGLLGDAVQKVPRGQDMPAAAFAPVDDAGGAHGSPAVTASPDDDLFEPETLDTDYVSPRPPRELIFRPSALPIDPEPAVRITAQSPAEVWAAANASAARMPAAVAGSEVGPEVARQVETELPPVLKDVGYAEIVPEPMAAPTSESAPVLDAVVTIGATEFAPAAVDPIAVPDDAQFVTTMPPEAADARMNASIEDLLGALAAGLAQQMPAAPTVEAQSAEPEVEANTDDVLLPEGDVSDDAARRTVTDALAAIAAANSGTVTDIETVEPMAATEVTSAAVVEPVHAVASAVVADAVSEAAPVPVLETLAAEADASPNAAIEVVEGEAIAPVVAQEPLVVEAASAPVIASVVPAIAAGLVTAGVAAVAVAAPAPAEPAVAAAEPPQSAPVASATPPMEDAVSSLLRPLIKDWLDRNMPTLVEKALKDELKSRSEPTYKAD